MEGECQNLSVPKVRKSVDVLREISKCQSESLVLNSPQATSTVEKQPLECFVDKFLCKNTETNDSSLGLLDMDACKAIGDDSALKSISFNPKEISGRSTTHLTQSDQASKENLNPSIEKMSINVKDIIETAKAQSGNVDNILKSSNDPRVSRMRESLQFYRQSIGVGNQTQNQSSNVSMLSDSNFFPAKINISDEEMAWLNEKGEIPIQPKLSLLNSTKDHNSLSSQINNGLDFSKMSVGNYFERRCHNIDDFLRAPSPEDKKLDANINKTIVKDSPDNMTLTSTLNSDDTVSPFSLTQIRNLVGNLQEAERPSVMIDKMLGLNKNKIVSKEVAEPNENASMFHSTKNATKDLINPFLNNTSSKISPIKDSLDNNTKKNTTESTNSSQDTFSTVKTFRKSNIPGSFDSKVTKNSLSLDPIKEKEMSPGIIEKSDDKSFNCLTPSDVSKEIKDLMTPTSNEKSFHTPPSGRHVKRLMDRYQHMNDGWVSPLQTKINDLSKECIPSTTPFRNVSNINENSVLNESDKESNKSTISNDWIKIESELKSDLTIGIPGEVKLRLISQSSGWISVKLLLNSVYINDEIYTGDLSDVLILQAPIGKFLLKADSEIDYVLKITTLKADVNLDVKIEMNMIDIVTQCTSKIQHNIYIASKSPDLYLQNADKQIINRLEFPKVPEECKHVLPILIWNNCKEDLPVMVDVKGDDCYSIIHTEIIFDEDEIKKKMNETRNDGAKLKKDIHLLPQKRKAALLVVVLFSAPKLSEDETLRDTNAELNILLMPSSHESFDPISIKSVPIQGGVGVSSLLIRNNQKSEVLVVHQGTSEAVEMLNAGSITSHYKLYIAAQSDKSDLNLTECDRGYFLLDKSDLILEPNEKANVRITYPVCEILADTVSRLLVFESPYKLEVVRIVGTPSISRCSSQQSTYSVESSSQSDSVPIKSSKKELTWGSVKAGQGKIQDVVFKNASATRKLRLVLSVVGEGFKMVTENGTSSSTMITLQPQECRTLNVEFKPLHDGGHTGSMRISRRCNPSIADTRLLYKIPLHGVCGQSSLIFRDGVFRYAGTQGLPLGPFQDSGPRKEIYFIILNRGTMPGFVLFNIQLKWKYRSLGDKVFVTPKHAIIKPGESLKCWITVPRTAVSLAGNQYGDTEVVASLFTFHGDETTRQRIKKICDENHNNSVIEHVSDLLNARFQDEDEECVSKFKESPVALKVLLDELQQKEVAVTYDLNLDYSAAHLSSSDPDETLQFHTICDDTLTRD